MKFSDLLNKEVQEKSEIVEKSEKAIDKKPLPDDLFIKHGLKIKTKFGTKFGTEYVFYKVHPKDEFSKILKGYKFKYSDKSIFVEN